MKKEKSLTRRKGEPYPLEIRLAAIGEYRLGVSRKEIAFKYSISDPTVISHWIRKFEAKRQSSVSITNRIFPNGSKNWNAPSNKKSWS